jgi:ketol-acid reductoisomerase
MSTRVWGDDDADLALVQDRNVAVLGYDEEARAHALCLRDSGVDVRIGLDPASQRGRAALDDGLRVVGPYEACEEADLFVLLGLAPDDPVVADVVLPNLVRGDAVVLGTAGSLDADLPAGVDVVRVAAWSDGTAVRAEYAQGRGVAMFATVVVDGSGTAGDVALAYARAIGGTRAGVIVTTEQEYQRAVDESRALLHGEVLPRLRAAFDRAVDAGSTPELAYVLCVQALQSFARDVNQGIHDDELVIAVSEAGRAPSGFAAAAELVRALTGRRPHEDRV